MELMFESIAIRSTVAVVGGKLSVLEFDVEKGRRKGREANSPLWNVLLPVPFAHHQLDSIRSCKLQTSHRR